MYYLKLLEKFSLLTVGDDKIPNFGWKKLQTQKLTKDQFLKNYQYSGGKTFTDNDGIVTEVKPTKNVGIITGFEDLEVIDIDLKVYSTAKEKTDFWNEYLGYLRDNILDFDDKFVIYKTMNDGYHILYKSKRVDKNTKIAKLKGHTEAIIETRGKFGYVFIYENNKVSKNDYLGINYISDQDREILWSFSKMYNYIEEIPIEPKKDNKVYNIGQLTPWEDYNQKTSILDLINDSFTIVGNHSKKYVIKRNGASSPHSGYVFKDNGFMYLHSTGSMYDAEKIYTPFLVYCKKYHNDDFKAAASDLYKQGFGSRFVKEVVPVVSDKIKSIEFPLEIFPDVVEKYILHCKERLMLNEDFMSGALLWMTSILIGNSMKIEAKKGWLESPILFIALVGRAGLGKTPSTKPIIAPVKKINQKKIEDYLNKYKEYERYIEATKKEQAGLVPIDKPRKKQILAEDTTIEALINLHNESNKSIGVFKDELDGWFKDMNKYRDGSDKQKWLSIWSNESIIVNRVSRPDLYIASPFISVMGGIQPTILDEQFTTENIANGFIDRFLFCYPEKIIFEQFSLTDLEEHISEWWSDSIIKISDSVAQFIKKDENDNIIPFICKMSTEGFKTWIVIFNAYSSLQNSDDEIESNKSMIAKIKVYIPRFALIIHFLDCMFHSKDIRETLINKETILKADLLAQYFINQFKKIKIDSAETSKIKSNISNATDNESFVKKCYEENPDFNRTKIAELLGISRQMVYRYLKK